MEPKQLNALISTLTFLILLLPICLFSQKHGYLSVEEIQAKAEARYLSDISSKKILRKYRSTQIEKTEVVNSNLVIVKGHLSIYGTVNGNILVVFGDVDIYDSAVVNGNITSIDGIIYLHKRAKVNGTMLETSHKSVESQCRKFNRFIHQDLVSGREAVQIPAVGFDGVVRYNRVEGFFLGLEMPKQFRRAQGHFIASGFAGYGFESKKIRYQLGLDRWFFNLYDYRTELGFEYHDLTDTKDLWRIGFTENSLAAFFLKDDYHDYFRRKGFSLYWRQNVTPFVQTTIEYRNDEYETLSKNTNWALFGDDKLFRENPALGNDSGTMGSFLGEFKFDTRNDSHYSTKGIYMKFAGEISSPGLGGDFDFMRYLADFRFYVPLSRDETLIFRTIAGASKGDLPIQKNFELGGISTLRAFSFKQFSGNGMFLANIEYHINARFLGIKDLNFIIFGDAGDTWNGLENKGIVESFRPLKWDRLKTDIGFGLADVDGQFRLNIAKRTDRSENDVRVTLRFMQPF